MPYSKSMDSCFSFHRQVLAQIERFKLINLAETFLFKKTAVSPMKRL